MNKNNDIFPAYATSVSNTLSSEDFYHGTSGNTIHIRYNGWLSSNQITPRYSVMELPRSDLPIAVFANGRLLTIGLLGTDVQCAYTGDKLIFEPGVLEEGGYNLKRRTISLEYDNEIYHYNIDFSNGEIKYKNYKSSMLSPTLVSRVAKNSQILGSK